MSEFMLAIVLFVLIFGAFFAGRILGQVNEKEEPHLSVVQGAALGILGLMMGFSYSGAMSRFGDRQNVVVNEANSIGTAWMHADLIPETQRGQLRSLLKQYTNKRIELVHTTGDDESKRIENALFDLQQQIWDVAVAGVRLSPGSDKLVLTPLDEVFDQLGTRNSLKTRHIPVAVFVVMVLSAMLSVAMISYGQARRKMPLLMPALGLNLLIWAVMWVTIDLDLPQQGVIRISDEPLVEALRQMK
ncbi:MAG: hypothetical protein U0640_00885 [Phycisphaerales bacterium]